MAGILSSFNLDFAVIALPGSLKGPITTLCQSIWFNLLTVMFASRLFRSNRALSFSASSGFLNEAAW